MGTRHSLRPLLLARMIDANPGVMRGGIAKSCPASFADVQSHIDPEMIRSGFRVRAKMRAPE
jgi:hypothetical protein